MSSRSRAEVLWSDLVEGYGVHLERVCAVGVGTCKQYKKWASEFLETLSLNGGKVDLARITRESLTTFVASKAKRYKPRTTQGLASGLRNFLRYLQFEGFVGPDLERAVPAVPVWRQSSIPKSLDEDQLAALLGSFDRSKPQGLRDYAMVLCLSGLGLRAGEVAALCLDDIDWRQGILCIRRSKSRRGDRLPLPDAVGRAIVAYLRRGRPQTKTRQIFVLHGWQVGKGVCGNTVSTAVRAAFNRSGLDVPSKGSHVLRHTAATHMIRRGVSLKEIADVLRHRSLETTTIYAKVDLPALSAVAMPWPYIPAGILRRWRTTDHARVNSSALAAVAMPWPGVAP